MAIEHPYHTIFQVLNGAVIGDLMFSHELSSYYVFSPQLLALANGDRVKDKQRSRNSFVVDLEKKYAAENLLKELSTNHGNRIMQVFCVILRCRYNCMPMHIIGVHDLLICMYNDCILDIIDEADGGNVY